jgi:hypothetical protein
MYVQEKVGENDGKPMRGHTNEKDVMLIQGNASWRSPQEARIQDRSALTLAVFEKLGSVE